MSIRVRFVGIATSLLLALVSLAGPLAAPAVAGYSTLCWGYAGCSSQGMSDAGYGKANKTMYWRMYAGHNCTNYAAYRMVKAGMPNTRPWSGSGNAENWGLAMSHLTNQTPTVGAIAWWKQNVWPAGSAGHVAYVEKVVSPTEIIVSQDSWGGNFSWARITKDGKGWPNGFVHFRDVRLANTAAPTISGVAKVGGTLTAGSGSWSPSSVSLSYQWYADGAPVSGATAATYVPTTAQVDRLISVTVTATKTGYPSASASATHPDRVLPGAVTPTVTPSIAGEPVVGTTLEVVPGAWVPEPATVRYRWRADGEFLGQTDRTLTVTPEMLGKNIDLRVAALRSGFTKSITVARTSGPVKPGTLTTQAPVVSGTPRLGSELTLQPGSASPEAAATITWLRAGAPVPEVTGSTYPLTEADLGQRIAAQVQHQLEGYTTVVLPSPASPVVKSTANVDLTVKPLRRPGRARVIVQVTAPGIASPTGTVVLRAAGKLRGTLEVVDGVARTTLTGIPSGKRVVRARLRATPVTTWHRDVVTAQIR